MDLPSLLKAALLGVVEGVTEFVPVSSTGHLILASRWLGFRSAFGPDTKVAEAKEAAFLVFIQLGAILAVVWLYRAKLLAVVAGLPREPKARRLAANLVLATLPAVIVGLPTDDWIEEHFFKPLPVAIALVGGGIAILLVERWCRRPRIGDVDDVPVRTAVGVGCFQVLAILFPGVSRAGATIMGGLTLGLSRTAATEFSFFLAIPAMVGASAVKLVKARDVLAPDDALPFAVGFVVAFLSALVVIRGLIAFVSRRSFAPFAWYRIVFGLILIALYWNARDGF